MKKSSKKDWPIVAICYDFDKTLSPKDMQEFSLLPKLKCDAKEFWTESNEFAKKASIDKILSYMKLILEKAKSCHVPLKESDFNEMGRDIVLFDGVETWFDRINKIAEKLELNVEHYIISAGLKEIIEGSSIAKNFTHIYASSFYYAEYDEPIWPGQVVNYTTKTQYLFRISKNCLDLSDEDQINEFVPEDERRIPFKNFIYIGDSETDIPAMRIIKNSGGTSIGVYNKETGNLDKVRKLLENGRIDFFAPADYTEKSQIENIVESVLNKIKAQSVMKKLAEAQGSFVDKLDDIEYLYYYTEDYLDDNELSIDELKYIKKQANQMLQRKKRKLINEETWVPKETGEKFIGETKAMFNTLFQDKEKKINESNNKKSDAKQLNVGTNQDPTD